MMRLKSLNYSQFKNDPREWQINNLVLNDLNLVVGKNAVGKSKTLNVINGLSMLLSSGTRLLCQEGSYDVLFDHDGVEIRYILEYHNKTISREEFRRDDTILLKRGDGGAGTIFAEKEGKEIVFQTPQDEIAAVARRDSLQHSYLEPLYQWANRVLIYHFGSPLGRDNLVLFAPTSILQLPPADLRNENAVIAAYCHAYQEFGDPFDTAIREDMQAIGYKLDSIGVNPLEFVHFNPAGQMAGSPIGLVVKEADLPCVTEHTDISTGMFRALSLLVQLNYAFMSNYPSCILVDDIGEGLDYTRSCSLIERLMAKAQQAGVQLVMSTNDRFVMNTVPLEAWTILQRSQGYINVFNYKNSKQAFDDFKFSGLNNFDFFAYDYLNAEATEGETVVEVGNIC